MTKKSRDGTFCSCFKIPRAATKQEISTPLHYAWKTSVRRISAGWIIAKLFISKWQVEQLNNAILYKRAQLER